MCDLCRLYNSLICNEYQLNTLNSLQYTLLNYKDKYSTFTFVEKLFLFLYFGLS